MHRAKINGTELEYEVRGSGEPVLLISTGPITDSFLPLMTENALAGRFQLIRYRQRQLDRGNGRRPVSFAEHAADAAALLDHLRVRRAHVAGHSTGAIIALELAIARPDLVNTLALLEPPLLAVPSAGAFFAKAGPALEAYGAGDGDAAMASFLSMVSSLDWETCRKLIEQGIPGGVAEAMRNADNFFESYLPALQAWDLNSRPVSQPILSVVGSDTEQLFVGGHELLHSWFPQVEDCRIDGAAHLLHMQRPAPVARGVAAFFAGHRIAEA